MEICEKEKCTGCSACAQICPKQCITMKPDGEGFLRPGIDERVCVDCGHCRKVCPINQPLEDDGALPMAFAAKHMDDDIREASSSGGVFSALASYLLILGGAVIAAGFDKNYRVVHKVCTCEDSLDELRRSKYVQSDINGMYREAKQRLEKGQKVLFCGTPCQIGGLIAFLGKPYSNLYTVDFICHGVPSPKLWAKYLAFRQKESKADVRNVSFRNKVSGWANYSMRLWFDNGTEYCSTVREDYYLRTFIMNMDLRPSCNQCKFKQVHRLSDITLADFWGIKEVNPSFADDKGISLVLVHSEKGQELIGEIQEKVQLSEVDCVAALQSNPSFTKSVSVPSLRNRFMEEADLLDFAKLHDKFCGTSFPSRIRRKIANLRRK